MKKDNKPHIRISRKGCTPGSIFGPDLIWVCSLGPGKLMGRSYSPLEAWRRWKILEISYGKR